jgi:diguanylate cyclase (GGDEF)-like protein
MESIKQKIKDFQKDPLILDFYIGDIALEIEAIKKEENIMDAFIRFMKDEKLSLIPVINDEYVIGQLHRTRFLEHTVLGRFGYGIHLNSKKTIGEVMEKPSLIIDYYQTLEEASNTVQSRKYENLYDDIIVLKNEKYYGIVPINLLLEVITKRAIKIAKDSNPLTGFPGNWAIQRYIERNIKLGSLLEIAYIDINYFKPYNDLYGFEKGDHVIYTMGKILYEINQVFPLYLIGHIGGDDFIIITPPGQSKIVCQQLITKFEEYLPYFHGEDFIKGYYISINRKEEEEKFPLLSLSCAIVSNESRKITSFAHLASIASEVKAEAKKIARLNKKSIIFEDRRND